MDFKSSVISRLVGVTTLDRKPQNLAVIAKRSTADGWLYMNARMTAHDFAAGISASNLTIDVAVAH